MEIKNYVTIGEAKAFVDTAVALCYDNEGKYQPMLKDFASKYAILAYYTDYPIAEKEIEEIYSDVYNSEIGEKIRTVACENEQLLTLINAVDEELYIRKEREIRTNKAVKFLEDIIDVANQASTNPETAELVKNTLEKFAGEVGTAQAAE